jgi:hypothetical protein
LAEILALRHLAAQVDMTLEKFSPSECLLPSRICNEMRARVGFHSENGQSWYAAQSRGDGLQPFIIFDSLPYSRDEIVGVTIWDKVPSPQGFRNKERYSVLPPEGEIVPTQATREGA